MVWQLWPIEMHDNGSRAPSPMLIFPVTVPKVPAMDMQEVISLQLSGLHARVWSRRGAPPTQKEGFLQSELTVA